MSNENVGPMMTKHPKRLSKAETDAFRSNDWEKMNGMKSLEWADTVEKTEFSPIPRRDSNENQSENQGEVEKSSESKPVIAARRDLFVSDKDDSSAPSQTPAVKRMVKKFEKRPITVEEGALNPGKTCEDVIDEKATVVANECVKQIQSLDEKQFKDIGERMEEEYQAVVKKMKVLYDMFKQEDLYHDAQVKKLNDRMKQAKLRPGCCVCERTVILYCCFKSYYCSLSCQAYDWPTHKYDCQQQQAASNDPYLSLNPNHRYLLKKVEDIKEDKKPVTESSSPTQTSTFDSLSSDPTKDEFPISPALPKIFGGTRPKVILPKKPRKV